MKNIKEKIFWYDDSGKIKIIHSKLIKFLEVNGFVKVKLSGTNYVLAKLDNNIISESSEDEAIEFVKCYLEGQKLEDVYEIFAKGLGSYISKRKLSLLKSIELIDDRDDKDSSDFYFKNCFCNVSKDKIKISEYNQLKKPIWQNRINNNKFDVAGTKYRGQFEKFCKLITKEDDKRFEALKSILGYLLHRNKERGETKAMIFYDELMGVKNQANGGTGKTLMSQAISKCREVVSYDGKEIKTGSWFKNQRMNFTTDIIVYDDLQQTTSLESFFAMLTTGIEVEKKRQQSFYLEFEKSPKVMITSNYVVRGPGGSSDKRRRHEYELGNYFNSDLTPEMVFGNRFFDNNWDNFEWNKFYHFMMECVQLYLKNGIIDVPTLNLDKAKLSNYSNTEFVEFASKFLEYNTWIDKRVFQESFNKIYPEMDNVSPHLFSKWLTNYSNELGGTFEAKSSGGDYNFIIKMKEVQDGI